MNRSKLLAIIVGGAVVILTGCDATVNTNSNANVVVSNVNSNINANTNSNSRVTTNTNRRQVNANISRAEYEKDKDTLVKDAKELGRTIGNGANDGWLWTKTRALLATADDLRDSTINVDVENEVVTLSGTVATPAQKMKAAQVAKGVEGVKSVKNNLTVSANP
jgi:osmotically-inducible protein OsmY